MLPEADDDNGDNGDKDEPAKAAQARIETKPADDRVANESADKPDLTGATDKAKAAAEKSDKAKAADKSDKAKSDKAKAADKSDKAKAADKPDKAKAAVNPVKKESTVVDTKPEPMSTDADDVAAEEPLQSPPAALLSAQSEQKHDLAAPLLAADPTSSTDPNAPKQPPPSHSLLSTSALASVAQAGTTSLPTLPDIDPTEAGVLLCTDPLCAHVFANVDTLVGYLAKGSQEALASTTQEAVRCPYRACKVVAENAMVLAAHLLRKHNPDKVCLSGCLLAPPLTLLPIRLSSAPKSRMATSANGERTIRTRFLCLLSLLGCAAKRCWLMVLSWYPPRVAAAALPSVLSLQELSLSWLRPRQSDPPSGPNAVNPARLHRRLSPPRPRTRWPTWKP